MGAAGRALYARRSTGDEFPVEIGLNPLPGEEQGSVIASIVDVSTRRNEEERMRIIMRELTVPGTCWQSFKRWRGKLLYPART